jgi:hypothetical protein
MFKLLASAVHAWVAALHVLDPQAALWAALMPACSDRLLWHSCDAIPYAVEAMVALGIISLYLISRTRPVNRRILAFAVLAPAVVWLTYPGCFLWEYDYYLRHLGAACQPLDGREYQQVQGGRMWLVVAAQTTQHGSELVHGFLENRWPITAQRDLTCTTVVLLALPHS